MYGTEYFDNTPSSNFNTSKIIILDGNVGIDGLMDDLSLVGATSATKNDLALTVYLTEAQRVRCIQASGTSGGDGENVRVTVESGSIQDLSSNPVLSSLNLTVEEHADTTAPVISDVILNLDLGRLSILFSETIDVSPGYRVNVSDLALFDDASGESLILFYLAKSRLSTVVDASRLNITLDPFERVGAVANSSFLDGSPLKLQANAVAHDVAFNYNINPALINITEIPDLSPIVTVNASIDYNDGTLTIFH